ncbi:hypothetical protein ACQPZA_24595 [Pseudonocardia xinjiangensis]|uniref:Uncharacterized protein n=1 Tax=Pseudonocardia xinjiangensis TaxID=75289 RepID=A0ABX1RN29_9PSEU|nr:hypothetical protein [Pseudonocardia xinjiangensis]NMH81797.1 hypothetical protein [Pseudonocardia xinjiangensis]
MAFRWRYLDAAGEQVDGPDHQFDDQQQAEDWFAAGWRPLRESGVDAVTLLDGDTEVYGPMSLHEA